MLLREDFMDYENWSSQDEEKFANSVTNAAVMPQMQQNSSKRSSGMENAAMVMGIVSIVTACCCGIGIIFGGLAITFACLSRVDKKYSGSALTGLITGSIGIAIAIVSVILFFVIGIMSDDSTLYGSSFSTMYQIGLSIKGVMI